jgi:hypothetical protein
MSYSNRNELYMNEARLLILSIALASQLNSVTQNVNKALLWK